MRFLLLSAACLSAVACFHLGGDTSGAHGNADFSYSSCLFGCTTTTPMMLGDEEDVTVTGSIPDSVSFETTSPSIVSIESSKRSCCTKDSDAGTTCRDVATNDACAQGETASLVVTVRAPAVGTSDLVIKKSDGSTWDSVTLSVEQAASLALACNTKGSVALPKNGTCSVTWQATDGTGKALMSTGGVHLVTSDPTVAAFSGFLTLDQSEIQATPQLLGGVSIDAIGPGDATVTATGGGATETLAVHVSP